MVAERRRLADNLHEWRKQTKYLWHQLQVLEPLWPSVLAGLAEQAHALSQHLGDDHDLAMLRDKLLGEPDQFADAAAVSAVVDLLDRRRVDLQKLAVSLGRRLYAERPARFAARLRGYWKVSRSEARATAGSDARQPAGA